MAPVNSSIIVLGLRIAQAVLAVITLGLSAYVASWWSSYWHAIAPSQISFLAFASVWALLALLYLVIVPWRFSDTVAHHKFVILGVETVTMLFWFAGFIALAVFLSDRVCWGHVCSSAKAAAVFAAFEWLCWAGTTGMAVMHVIGSRGNTAGRGKVDPNLNMHEGV